MILSKNQVSYIRSLKLKKFRDIEKKFIVEGHKLVVEILCSSFDVEMVYAIPEWIEQNQTLCKKSKVNINEISQSQLEAISLQKTPNQVLAIVKIIEPINFPKFNQHDCVLILDQIGDPGNLGTIIRTADWFGIKHIICSNTCVDLYNPKTVQATMGSITRVQVYYTNLPEFLNSLKGEVNVYGAFLKGKNSTIVEFKRPCILIIGNESQGISPEVDKFVTEKIFIQPHPNQNEYHAESLNASVSAAILLYEVNRNL